MSSWTRGPSQSSPMRPSALPGREADGRLRRGRSGRAGRDRRRAEDDVELVRFGVPADRRVPAGPGGGPVVVGETHADDAPVSVPQKQVVPLPDGDDFAFDLPPAEREDVRGRQIDFPFERGRVLKRLRRRQRLDVREARDDQGPCVSADGRQRAVECADDRNPRLQQPVDGFRVLRRDEDRHGRRPVLQRQAKVVGILFARTPVDDGSGRPDEPQVVANARQVPKPSFDRLDRGAGSEDPDVAGDRVGLVAVVELLQAEDAGGDNPVAGVQADGRARFIEDGHEPLAVVKDESGCVWRFVVGHEDRMDGARHGKEIVPPRRRVVPDGHHGPDVRVRHGAGRIGERNRRQGPQKRPERSLHGLNPTRNRPVFPPPPFGGFSTVGVRW